MTFNLVYSTEAAKQIRQLPSEVQKRVFAVLDRVRVRPGAHFKKLTNKPYFRLRVGAYRIITDIKRDELHIMFVMHRKNAYKLL
jgi:mRNA-degrading endonuclease RelE of RelBE toxin-antitoxin system